jgi:hypothetical protein
VTGSASVDSENVVVEHLIDLDALVTRLASTVEVWRRSSRVQPFTWRDAEADWPQPIVTDRSSVRVPESLGIRLDREPDDELEIVVWTGGWADIGFLLGGEVTDLYAEFTDLDGAYAAVARSVEDFLA